MILNRLVIVLGLGMLCVNNLYCQHLTDDLTKIRQRYYHPKGQLDYTLKIKFYDRKNRVAAIDSTEGNYSFAYNKMNLFLEGTRTISDGKYMLTISENEKIIIVSKPSLNNYSEPFTYGFIDSIAQASKVSIIKRIQTPILASYRFSFKDQNVDSVILKYKRNTFELVSIIVYYNQPINEDYKIIPIIQIQYINQINRDIISNKKFDLSKYVKIENEKVVLTPKYSTYSLINNLSF